MAEESPSEREERLQKAEERLTHQHERLKDRVSAKKSGGGSDGLGFFSNIAGFLGEHKLVLILVGGVIVFVSIIAVMNRSKGTSTGNQQGDLSTAGYQTQGEAYGFDQITQSLNNITRLLSQQGNSNPPPNNNPPPPTNNPPTDTGGPIHGGPIIGGPLPAPKEPRYVEVTPWPTSHSTLWGIAQSEGISLSRIEQLNPQLNNQQPGSGFNLIYPGQRVKVSE